VKNDNILPIIRENMPETDYLIWLYPVMANNLHRTESSLLMNMSYTIVIGCRVMISQSMEEQLYGTSTKKGLMDLVSDIFFTIKDDPTFGVNSSGTSISMSSSSTSYALSSSARYLTISVDGLSPSGYNQVDCGTSTLTGTQIASNIQTSLRALANSAHPADPYATVTCTYDNDEKRFTITSPTTGGRSSVVVTAGSTNDASSVLGFDKPKETRGANIIVTRIDVTYPPPEEEFLPAIHGRLDLYIEEEVYFD
jgi:hypothetical protein